MPKNRRVEKMCFPIVVTSILATGWPSAVATATESPRKPNFLLILADDIGDRSLSCFGGTVPTPHLDRLAREGLVFRNAHAAPMCAPTRDELFTGLSRAGRGRPDASVPFFTNHLRELGYVNGMAGKWFVGKEFDPPLRGFDEALVLVNGYRHWAPDVMVFGSQGMMKELNQPEVQGRLNEWEIPRDESRRHHATRLPERYGEDVAVDFLCDFMTRRKDKPFFAYYSSKLAHVPHAPTPDADAEEVAAYKAAFASQDDRNLGGLSKAVREHAKRLGATIHSKLYRDRAHAYLDKMGGRLIDKLAELGLLESTVVVFASDNGNSRLDPLPPGAKRLPGNKGDSREGGTRIPLIVHWPSRVIPGSFCNDLVHVQDFLPTLLELAGAKPPEGSTCDGRSFAPQILGGQGNPREYFIGAGAHPSCWLKRVASEVGKPDLRPFPLVWIRGHRYKLYNDGRFYDLEVDLAEARRIGRGDGSRPAREARQRYERILARFARGRKETAR